MNNYIMPMDKVSNYKNVILYGAGKVGRSYYKQLSEEKNINVVLWTDKKYMILQEQGVNVGSIEDINKVVFDGIILAAQKQEVADEMKKELLNRGVAEEKIIWVQPIDGQEWIAKTKGYTIKKNEKSYETSVAILYIAIGQYACFWKGFYVSAERYLLPNTKKEYFIFTDQETLYADKDESVHIIFQEDLGWPLNTLLRFSFFNSIKDQLRQYDYIFFMNANILINQTITEQEFLPKEEDYLFVLHHAFWKAKCDMFPYDRNPKSQAYIPYNSGDYYITGGLNGGKAEAFLNMSKRLDDLIQQDKKNNVVALWHDESFINKYALKEKNFKLLSPAYFYPELVGSLELNCERKIIARDKRKYFDVSKLKEDASLFVINAKKQLSDAFYYRLSHKWLMLNTSKISCVDYLLQFEHIAIVGYRNFGEILINEIENRGKDGIISCILDADTEDYNGKYRIYKPYDINEDVELIIVADTYNFNEILINLSLLTEIKIVSLEDIIDQLLIKNNVTIYSKIW